MKRAGDLEDRIKQQKIQKAWDVFRKMGKDIVIGRLSDTSINHDQYLYRQKLQ